MVIFKIIVAPMQFSRTQTEGQVEGWWGGFLTKKLFGFSGFDKGIMGGIR